MKKLTLLCCLSFIAVISNAQESSNSRVNVQVQPKKVPPTPSAKRLSAYPGYKQTPDGFYYKVFPAGSGEKITAGNVIRYHSTYLLENTLLSTSYGSNANWLPISKTAEQNPYTNILLGARQGDSILIIQPVDVLLAKTSQAQQDPFLKKTRVR